MKMETREVNPDENQVLINDCIENLSKKESKDKQNITERNLENKLCTAEKEQENFESNIKESFKRVLRKEKTTVKKNGKKGYHKVM